MMELLPSIAAGDFDLFRSSINTIQRIGFKHRELQRQPESLSLVNDLQDQGYAAGMSSLGPAVFAISPNQINVTNPDSVSISTKAANSGASFY
jgi:beta-RFAP synthase